VPRADRTACSRVAEIASNPDLGWKEVVKTGRERDRGGKGRKGKREREEREKILVESIDVKTFFTFFILK